MENKTAIVMAVHKERYELQTERKEFYGRLKTANFYNAREIITFPTVGDVVEVAYNGTGDSQILKVLPRKSVLLRLNATQGLPDQAVAANFDYVFITLSLNKDFHISKLERYLTAAWQSGGEPVVILTKADLCEDTTEYVLQVEKIAPGIKLHCVSAVTGEGVAELAPYLQSEKTIVLLGSSGVGKSSLTNLLIGGEEMLTGEIREADAQGRHTTTYRQCIKLPQQITLPDGTCILGGGIIIDTPGIRKLLIAEAEEGIQTSFEDIEELAAQCRFRNCRHEKEPGCAVQAALANGTLKEKRWKNYRDMQREQRYAKEREEIILKRKGKRRY